MIAAGAIRACEAPIRTVATSVLNCVSLSAAHSRRTRTFTPRDYSNQVETGKTEQINEVLGSLLDFLIRSV